MSPIRILLNYRLSSQAFDARSAQLACTLGGVAIFPMAVLALVRHPGSRAEFLLGLGLAGLVALLCVMLGMLCRQIVELGRKVAIRSLWPAFASYVVGFGVFMTGVMSLPRLGLSPVWITLTLLVIGSLSLAIVVFGMLTSVVRSPKL